ncbi:MAG: polysaccharide deacetylase family protein [Clostridia bacterium]|nr:polysaccharide deacetylase family protein [Clostridia bacterium]
MNTFGHKQLLALLLIAALSLLLISGVWGTALYKLDALSSSEQTTPLSAGSLPTTTDSTVTESTSATASTETTTGGRPTVRPGDKVIALTFDDGPSATYTPAILDILEKYGARATFFMNGYQLGTGKASLLRRMVSMGCEIGNHTADHKYLTELSREEIYDQLFRVNELVYSLCGYRITLMRPPGGHTDLSVMEDMYNSGLRLKTILWNNDSLDWSFYSDYQKGLITREEAVQKTYDMICSYPMDGSIVLMHDIKGITPDVLELLLQKLSAEGYTFVTISELFDFESLGETAYFSKFYSQYLITPMKSHM